MEMNASAFKLITVSDIIHTHKKTDETNMRVSSVFN